MNAIQIIKITIRLVKELKIPVLFIGKYKKLNPKQEEIRLKRIK